MLKTCLTPRLLCASGATGESTKAVDKLLTHFRGAYSIDPVPAAGQRSDALRMRDAMEFLKYDLARLVVLPLLYAELQELPNHVKRAREYMLDDTHARKVTKKVVDEVFLGVSGARSLVTPPFLSRSYPYHVQVYFAPAAGGGGAAAAAPPGPIMGARGPWPLLTVQL